MAEIIDLGKLRFVFRGSYDSGTTYEKNDVVEYQGSSYVYKNATATAGSTPTSTTYWSQLAEGVYITGGDSGKLLTNNGTDTSWTATPSITTVTTSGDATVGDQLFVGSSASTFASTLTNPKVVIQTAPESDYAQVAFRNTGSSTSSSTDVIAYADNGTDDAGWIDMGITGSGFSDPSFTITGDHDGYIFMEAPAGTSGDGNLVIATGSNGAQNKIVFAAGGLSSDNTQMVIIPDENIHIEIPTASTSPTTGALTVVGGVGIQGDVNIQGTIAFGGSGTTVETSNLAVVDPQLYVNKDSTGDSFDSAFLGEYGETISAIARSVTNKALTSNVATLTTSTAHTYIKGDVVVVTGVDETFNGTHVIRSVPTSTTFTFDKVASNVSSAAANGTASVSVRRQFSGLMRDATDAQWKLIDNIGTGGIANGVIDLTGVAYANLRVGTLTASGLDGQGLALTGYVKSDLLWENATLNAGTSGTITLPVTTAKPITYFTANQTANRTLNITGGASDMAVGESVSFTVLLTNGTTAYYINTINVDGGTTGLTTRWQYGVTPAAGNVSGVDVYTFTIIKTAATPTYTVFATQTKW
jgi:hypothetical protein